MQLNEIKKELVDLNYFVKGHDKLICVGDSPSAPDDSGIQIYNLLCTVELIDNRAIVNISKSALPETEEFRSVSRVVAFITKKFPL